MKAEKIDSGSVGQENVFWLIGVTWVVLKEKGGSNFKRVSFT